MADTIRQERKALAVIEKHARARESIIIALIKALLGLWGSFDQWQDRDLVTGHAARSAVLVDASLAKTRRLARTYATTMLRNADAMPTRPMPPVENIYPRSGVTTVEVYSRAAEQYLYAVKEGRGDVDAREVAEQRLRDLAGTDVMLAERDETQRTYARSGKVIGRRRIIHPELSESGFSCGLCVVISDRVYNVKELMPVHVNCNCTDAPITAGFDPGLRLNKADLKKFYEMAGSTAAEDLVNVRVSVDEHGELGPIIRREGQNFRGPGEASTSRHKYGPFKRRDLTDQRESWQRMIESSNRAVELLEKARDVNDEYVNLVERGQPKSVSDFATAIKYHRDLINRYSARLNA